MDQSDPCAHALDAPELRAERRGAVFFDRDGVLIEDTGYVHRIEDVRWIAGAQDAVGACIHWGLRVFVVTNQSGVGRGFFPEQAVIDLHAWMEQDLARTGGRVDAFEFCPHHPEASVERYRRACRRRKPQPGMILDLIRRWNVNPGTSFLVGDRADDLRAAEAAGIAGHLFRGGNLRDFIAPLLPAAPLQEAPAAAPSEQAGNRG